MTVASDESVHRVAQRCGDQPNNRRDNSPHSRKQPEDPHDRGRLSEEVLSILEHQRLRIGSQRLGEQAKCCFTLERSKS